MTAGQDEAVCRGVGPEMFFSDEGGSAAKALCRRCPLRVACLIGALDRHEAFGVWGGAGEPVRRWLLRADHPHDGFSPDCECEFCERVQRHFSRLVGDQSGGPLVVLEGGAHGKASTYNFGCRCDPCREAKVASVLASRRRVREQRESA